MGQFVISIVTVCVSVLTLTFTMINSKKTRRITVLLAEKQKNHEEVFKHITSVLDLGRRCFDVNNIEELSKIRYELLNRKVLIWVYLNKENKYSRDMRAYCNKYIFRCVSSLEKETLEERRFRLLNNEDTKHIWLLIDKYIEEEEKLRSKLI